MICWEFLKVDRGHSAEAIADLRKAVELDPKNLRAAYALAEEIERQGDANSEVEVQQVMQKILAAQPDNLAALLELSRVAAKRGDAATLKTASLEISARSSAWPPEVKQQLAAVQAAAAGTDLRAAATRTTFLRNVLMRVPEYRQSLAVIKAPAGEEAQPFTHFLRLESPVFTPAPPDMAIHSPLNRCANADDRHWNWIGAIQLGSAGAPVIAEADGRRSAFVHRGDIFRFRADLLRFRRRRRESCKSTSTTISRLTWCSRGGRRASVPPGQPERVH